LSADALIARFEQEKSRALGRSLRRHAGLYYTPPEIAARVMEVALQSVGGASGRVLDPCAGAGAFLVAAARAGLRDLHGFDLDPEALRVARKALSLCGARARLRKADSLRLSPREPADLLVSNPPYGHVADARERAFLLDKFPALRGGEIDRYAAFLLRALQLVRPGGAAALLVPDTWMFLSRSGALREAVLAQAEVEFELKEMEGHATNVHYFGGVQFQQFGLHHVEIFLENELRLRFPLPVVRIALAQAQ